MELDNLLTLIDKVSASELDDFQLEDGSLKITMKKKKREVLAGAAVHESPVQSVYPVSASGKEQVKEPAAEGTLIKAPLVGTFYHASSPDSEPFVSVGDAVKKGQVLGVIEAMKLMNEIESECDGVVDAILVENEQMVEYGQSIFVIK